MDTTLVFCGIALLMFAIAMVGFHLWRERGSLLDPVAVSWIGYIVFIPVAMIGTGVLYPTRDTSDQGTAGCALMVVGTITYTLGLYAGKAIRFCRRLPSPKPSVSKSRIWIAWLIAIAFLPVAWVLAPWLSEFVGESAGVSLYMELATLALISTVGLVMLRGSPFSRITMVATIAAVGFMILWTVFSKRPLAGVMIAALGLVYHFRIARAAKVVKLWYMGSLAIAAIVLIIYLDATRTARYYKLAKDNSLPVFSEENLRSFFGGIEMNYRVYEFALQRIPSHHPFLYGTGYVPGLIWWPRSFWESKPYGTAYVLSQMWYNTEKLSNNLGLPTMGEAYANFGILGVIVVLFLVGRVIRIFNTYLMIHYDNVIVWAAWLMIVPDIIAEWRGDFTSMTAQSIQRIVGFLAIMWIAGKLSPRETSRAAGPERRVLIRNRQRPAWNNTQPVAIRQQPKILRRV